MSARQRSRSTSASSTGENGAWVGLAHRRRASPTQALSSWGWGQPSQYAWIDDKKLAHGANTACRSRWGRGGRRGLGVTIGIGCGTGRELILGSRRSFRHTGVDPGHYLLDLFFRQKGATQGHPAPSADATSQRPDKLGLPARHAGFNGANAGQHAVGQFLREVPVISVDPREWVPPPALLPTFHDAIQDLFYPGPVHDIVAGGLIAHFGSFVGTDFGGTDATEKSLIIGQYR